MGSACAGPLTEAEFRSLEEFFLRKRGRDAISMEHVDGFLAALVAGPDPDFTAHPKLDFFGDRVGIADASESTAEEELAFKLLARHWLAIEATLQRAEPYFPHLGHCSDGFGGGNDWAVGFMRGVECHYEHWSRFMDSDIGGAIMPMLVLAHEHDQDQSSRPPAISAQQRHEILALIPAGLLQAYQYFRDASSGLVSAAPEARGTSDIVGYARAGTAATGRSSVNLRDGFVMETGPLQDVLRRAMQGPNAAVVMQAIAYIS